VTGERASRQVIELINQAIDAADVPQSDHVAKEHLARKGTFSLAELVGDDNADVEALARVAKMLKRANKQTMKGEPNAGRTLWHAVVESVSDEGEGGLEERCVKAVAAVDGLRLEGVQEMLAEQKAGLARHSKSAKQRMESWKQRLQDEEEEATAAAAAAAAAQQGKTAQEE
jgi:hypothetical protein